MLKSADHRQGIHPTAAWKEPITKLRLSGGASNCLRKAGVRTIGDLIGWREEDLKRLHGFGEDTLQEITGALANHGLRLGIKGTVPRPPIPSPEAGARPDTTDSVTGPNDIEVLNLGVHASNYLRSIGIDTLDDLVQVSTDDVAKATRLGIGPIREIICRLKERNLSLRLDPPIVSSDAPVAVLNLSRGTTDCLRKASIRKVGDLIAWSEDDLKEIRSLGEGTLREIVRALAKHGLRLGAGVASPPAHIPPLTEAGARPETTDSVSGPDDIEVLNLGGHTSNYLRSIGIDTLDDLVKVSADDMAKATRMGIGTIQEIIRRLKERNLSLRRDPPIASSDAPVPVLNLNRRTTNCLRRASIRKVGDLIAWSEDDLKEIRSLGEGTLREIVRALAKHGLRLGADVASPPAHTPPLTAVTKPDRDGTHVTLTDDVGVLNLGVRASNCLRAIGVRTVYELVALSASDLAMVRNLGRGTLAEIWERLREHNLSLGMETRSIPTKCGSSAAALSIAPSLAMGQMTEIPVLDRSIGSLELGTRADNCLRSAGVRTVRDLVAYDRRQLLDLPHMGTGTLEEIVAVMAELGLELRNPLEDFWQTLRAGLNTVDEELKYVVSTLVSPRYRNVVMRRLGWSGQPASTLEVLAANPDVSLLGRPVTRERVRQIENKGMQAIRKGLNGLCPRRSLDALRLVSESTPVTADDVPTLLRKHGLSRSALRYSALCRIAELTGTAWEVVPLTTGRNPVLVSTENHADYAVALEVLGSARSQPYWRVNEVVERAPQPAKMATLLTRLVEAHPEYRWLDRDAGLFWNAARDSNRILFQCRKLFSLADCLHVDELRTGVQRTRTVTAMPPKNALIEMLRQTDWLEIHENCVQRRDGISFDALSSEDRRLVRAVKGMGRVVRFSEIRDNLVREGVSSVQAGQNLLFSPFLFRVARGRYRLLFDADGEAANVVRAAEEGHPQSVDGVHENSTSERVWSTVVRISRRGMITDRMPIDGEVPGGQWDVVDESGHVGQCAIDGGVVRKLAEALRHGGVEVGEYCRLSFDFESKSVEIEKVTGDQRRGSLDRPWRRR